VGDNNGHGIMEADNHRIHEIDNTALKGSCMHLICKLTVPLVLSLGLASWLAWDQRLSAIGQSSSQAVSLGQSHGDNVPAAGKSLIVPLDAQAVAQASATIDQLMDAALVKRGIAPEARASDEVYIRRVYLDIVGRIPTAVEVQEFITSKKSDKRELLVKKLIASDGYVSHQYNFWADLLRATTRMQNRYPGQPYIDYIKQSLRDNKPYDKWVSEMIQAEGPALAEGNGATGYYIRDAGMPLDNMSNTIQVFMGTQLACAQCHNHPTDTWTRMDYFEMAAFTADTSVDRHFNKPEKKAARKSDESRTSLKEAIKDASPQVRNAVRRHGETVGLMVKDKDSGTIKLPADYQYADAKGGTTIQAQPMFGEITANKNSTPRATYAAWLISQERFAQVIANRMWKKVFAVGLVEPVDNFKQATIASHPEVMDFITRLMVTVKFDLRKFQEILYATETYQRATLRQDVEQEAYVFQGRKLQRLSAEQVWDSLMTLAVSDVDTHKGPTAERLHTLYEKNKDMTLKEIFEQAKEGEDLRMQGAELRKEFQQIKDKLSQVKDGAEKAALIARLKELGERRDELLEMADPLNPTMKKNLGEGKGKGPRESKNGQGNLLRASEVLSPAPGNHFLRTFGQSDRELIDNSTKDAAVTQALALMNGLVESDILSNRSVLYSNVMQARGAEAQAQALWLTVMSRQPTMQELQMASRLIAIDPQAIKDLAWALINSREFLFIQ
jgi:Protein of unknown function (DUF1549)/Protein of unknown function (DUF1553)